MSDCNFKIIQHLADLSSSPNGWAKELNFVSWNGSAPKYDIRSWSSDHTKMGIFPTSPRTGKCAGSMPS